MRSEIRSNNIDKLRLLEALIGKSVLECNIRLTLYFSSRSDRNSLQVNERRDLDVFIQTRERELRNQTGSLS